MLALFHASSIGRTDVVQSAISSIRSVQPKAFDEVISRQREEDGATALHLASLLNHADVVRALLNVGCDLGLRGTAGEYAGKRPYECCGSDATTQAYHVFLFEAVAMNKPERVQKLLNGGVPVGILEGSASKETLLHWSCSFGHTDVSRVLLEYACDANALNSAQESPLFLAAKASNAPLVAMLLQEGAYSDVDLLASKPSADIVQLLKQAGKPTFKPTFPLKAIHEKREVARKHAAMKSNVDDPFALVDWEDERLTRKVERSKDEDIAEDEDDYLARQPLLVLWPPAQRQRRTRGAPLMLHSNSIVYIAVLSPEIDIYPLLTWSGLMDAFDSFNLTAQVKRSVPGSSLSLCIDRNLCPKAHQFELVITEERAMLVAADQTGLLYSIYAFIQLIQLHSEVLVVCNGKVSSAAGAAGLDLGNKHDAADADNTAPFAASNGNGSILNGTALSLFPMVIKDWPDVANRAVMWSHRKAARLNARVVRSMVQLLSKLRINMIHLVVDCLNSCSTKVAFGGDNTSNRIGTNDNVASTENNDNTKLFAIFEVCSRHRVELIPTVVVSSLHQSMDIEMLRNCSSRSLNVLFLFEQRAVAAEMLAALSSAADDGRRDGLVVLNGISIPRTRLTTQMIEAVICSAITNILQQVQLAGFSSVGMGASGWTKRAADPLRIASNLGIAAVLHNDLDVIYPSALFTKPLVSAQGFIATMSACAATARGEVPSDSTSCAGGCSLSVFPAYMDSDFMTPMLMLKYYSFLHAGFTWNSTAMREMGLGERASAELDSGAGTGAEIIREVVGLLLFPEEATRSKISEGNASAADPNSKSSISVETLDAVMSIFTGYVLANEADANVSLASGAASTPEGSMSRNASFSAHSTPPQSPRSSTTDSNRKYSLSASRADLNGIVVPTTDDLVLVEQIIWCLVTSKTSVADALVPTKAEAALCLRYCRRILNASKWNGGYKGKKSLFDNVGGMLNNLASSIGTGTSNTKELGSADVSTHRTDIDELFSCITVMSVVCRALVLSYNQLQKESAVSDEQSDLTLEKLLFYLPLGTTSDVANSLLEAVEQCTSMWRRRFENMAFLDGADEEGAAKSGMAATASRHARNPVEGITFIYLTQEKPSLPCRSFFEVLNQKQKFQLIKQGQEEAANSVFYSLFFSPKQ